MNFQVELLEDTFKTYFRLEFDGVASLHLDHECFPYLWGHLELTDISVEQGQGYYVVAIGLWSMAELTIKCKDVKLFLLEGVKEA